MSTASDRLRAALTRVNDALNPDLVYFGVWEYSVIAVSSTVPPIKVDCEVLDPETALVFPKQISGMVLWPGPGGTVAVPNVGSVVRVAFVNGDPSKPYIMGLDPNASPSLVYLDGTPGPFVAREGDTITITQAQFAAAGAANSAGAVTTTAPMQGTITSGSTKVQCP